MAYRFFDKFALAAAQLVLIDTEFRAAALASDTHGRPLSIPVGAPEWAVPRPGAPNDGSLRVLYYGNYIRLHGLDFVLAAIAMLEETDTISFTFLGDGEDRPHIESEVAALGIEDRVTFAEPVPEKELAEIIANHHVVLGVFGESTKAQGVRANKVWQGLACGRLVVTRESSALKEIETIAGDQLLTVSTASPANLTNVLRAVSKAPRGAYPDITLQLTRYTHTKLDLLDQWLQQNA
jgi:glycosyltransferase involved in cell wall biosynthesis